MSILVTCATGFIGRAFVRALREQGQSCTVLINKPNQCKEFAREEIVVGDILNPLVVQEAIKGIDTIVHIPPRTVRISSNDSEETGLRQAHIHSTEVLLKEARSANIKRFLFMSSAHATGKSPNTVLCECAPVNPSTLYARIKLEAEHLVLAYSRSLSFDAVILRPAGVYGPGDKSLVSSLIRAARQDMYVPLGGVTSQHSLVFVDDLVKVGLRLLSFEKIGDIRSNIFIVKDSIDYRIHELYLCICDILGKQPHLFHLPTFILHILSAIGTQFTGAYLTRQLAFLNHLLIPQRYCSHLLEEALPDFRFTNFREALIQMMMFEQSQPTPRLTT